MVSIFIMGITVFFLVLFGALSSAKKGDGANHRAKRTSSSNKEDEDLSLKDKLIIGAGMAHLIEAEERRYQEHKREAEKRRHDELFWQDAAREKGEDDFYDD